MWNIYNVIYISHSSYYKGNFPEDLDPYIHMAVSCKKCSTRFSESQKPPNSEVLPSYFVRATAQNGTRLTVLTTGILLQLEFVISNEYMLI